MDILKEKSLRLQEVEDLLKKAFDEAGEAYDYSKIKCLKGATDAEKSTEIKALTKERNDLDAEIAELEERQATKASVTKSAEARKVIPGASAKGIEVIPAGNDTVFTKGFKIPAQAKTHHSKVFSDDRTAYGFGMYVISKYGDKTGSSDTGRAKDWVNDHIDTKTLSGQAAETGGALVPYEFLPDLIDLKEEYGVFMRNTDAIQMTRETLKIPRNVTDNTAYWDTESGQVTESGPTFDNVNLVTKKLSAWISVPMELIEDAAISIADWTGKSFARRFAFKEDQAGFIGDGTGTHGNIVGLSTALLNLSATRANIAGVYVASDNVMAGLVAADITGFLGKLPAYAIPGAKIYCSNTVFWNVFVRIAIGLGGTNFTSALGDKVTYNFLGIPVEIVQVMPIVDANDQILALYGDINLSSKAGDRRAFNIATSDQVRFLNDQLVIRANERLDINNHDLGNESATAASRVAGPMVGLLSAAS